MVEDTPHDKGVHLWSLMVVLFFFFIYDVPIWASYSAFADGSSFLSVSVLRRWLYIRADDTKAIKPRDI
jgi:hypothetical protein